MAGELLASTNLSMMAPLLVVLAAEFDTSIGAVGQLSAASAIPWGLLAPFMGVLSDRYGRRPILAVGTTLLGFATLLMATAWSYGSLFSFRFVSGIAGATTGPNLMSSVADYFPPSRRGRALGFLLAGIALSTILGIPLLTVVAAHVGWRWSFFGLGLLLILLGAAIWLIMPPLQRSPSHVGYLSGFTGALAERSTPLLLVANLLDRVSYTAVTTYIAAFLMQSYSLRLAEVAPVLSAIAVGALLGSVFGGRLADRGRQAALFVGCEIASAAIAFPLFATTPGVIPTALLAAAFGMANSTGKPAWLWLVQRVPESRRGATMGFVATTNQGGFALGASIGGLLVGLGDYAPVGILSGAAALAAATICSLGASRMASPKRAHPYP